MKDKKVVHLIGNGFTASLYDPKKAKGRKYTCNIPPFDVPGVRATFMVDFKMMVAIHKQAVVVPAQNWILGMRPKIYCEKNPMFRLQYASRIQEFYTALPGYANTYTDFNCGHVATHYICNKLKADEVHLYGFDSIFDFDITSHTDFVLQSNRETNNTERLTSIWRPIWASMFKEFSDTKFTIYHKHDKTKVKLPNNVNIEVRRKK
jgi:hypothetical protein